jgi:hypothetical protein
MVFYRLTEFTGAQRLLPNIQACPSPMPETQSRGYVEAPHSVTVRRPVTANVSKLSSGVNKNNEHSFFFIDIARRGHENADHAKG